MFLECLPVFRPGRPKPRLRDDDSETQQQLAAEFGISHQRVAQIAARVEGWLATHGDHPLAARMRLRTSRRWDEIWSLALEGFERSREDRVVRKERVATTSGETRIPNSGETPLLQVTEITTRQQNGDPRFLALAVRVAEREDRRWQQAEPHSPVGRSRALAKLEKRVATLEKEGRELTPEKRNGTQGASQKKYPSALPQLPPLPPREPDYVGERVGGGSEMRSTPEAVVRDRGMIARCVGAVFGMLGRDGTSCASSTERGEIDAASCASSTELEAVASASRPHPSPLPVGEGAKASSMECGEIGESRKTEGQTPTRREATRFVAGTCPYRDPVPATMVPGDEERELVKRAAKGMYQPAPPSEWCYLRENEFDTVSNILKRRGDREAWIARQLELKRDLEEMIRRAWPDIDDVPSDEPTAAALREKHEEFARREAGRFGAATHPNRESPKREGTAGDDDDRQAASPARKRRGWPPRGVFVYYGSRATPYD